MKSLVVVAVSLVLLLVIALRIGARLPRDHVATVRSRYAASVDVIWSKLTAPAAYAAWRTDLKGVELLNADSSHPEWVEHGKHGDIRYVIAERTERTRLLTRITDETLPYGGTWEFTLTPDGTGTLLTITERGFVKPALFRLLSRFVFGLTGTLEAYHRSLARAVGETPAPDIVSSGR